MRIGIDCRLAGTKHAGIGRYIQNLLRHTLENDNHAWVLFFYDKAQAESVLGKQLNLPHVAIVYTPVRHYTLAEQLKMAAYFYRANLDLLHVPHFNAPVLYFRPFIVTIHDLLWHHHRGANVTTLSRFQYWFKYLFYRLTVRSAISNAKRIIVPAETIKATVCSYFPGVKDKIAVTYEGVDEALGNTANTERDSKTLLYVGSLYPHKNIKLVIKALKNLPEYRLEIAGSRNIFTEQTQEFIKVQGVEDQVEFLGYLTDKELQKKYSLVGALVQPSLSEGFGLTGVEAMAKGTPVLASDIPIFREIYQDGAIFFDPANANDFANAVKKLEKTDVKKLSRQAQKVAGSYSWKKLSEQTVEVYEQAL